LGSLASASGHANLDFPCGHLGVFLPPDELDLGGADVGMAGELTHFVQSTVTTHLKKEQRGMSPVVDARVVGRIDCGMSE
jgi:hypothetical protein